MLTAHIKATVIVLPPAPRGVSLYRGLAFVG